jgi:hypothetical protein
MAQEEVDHNKAERTRRRRPLRWWIGAAMLAAAIVLALLWLRSRLTRQSAEQQLAAIEAARSILDEENAAHLYRKLLDSYNEAEFSSYLMDTQTYYVTRRRPWRSADYPELAAWLQGQQDTIAKLKHICTFNKCRFPIGPSDNALQVAQRTQSRMALLSPVRAWAELLICSANNDVGERRASAGLQKYLAVMCMARHFRQQRDMLDYLVALAIEELALKNIATFVIKGSGDQEHLKAVEEALRGENHQWRKELEAAIEVERLVGQKLMGSFRLWLTGIFSDTDSYEKYKEFSLRLETQRHGVLILTGLKAYNNMNGRWPDTLEDIRPLAPAEAFVDPSNGGGFVYRLRADEFILYSKGQNNIDEDGQYDVTYDTETGEPNILPDDRLIWPLERRLKETDQERVEEERS